MVLRARAGHNVKVAGGSGKTNNLFLAGVGQNLVEVGLKKSILHRPLLPCLSLNQGIKLAQVNLEIEISRRVHFPLMVPLSFRFSAGGRIMGAL